MQAKSLLPSILKSIEEAKKLEISEERKEVLQPLVDYIQDKINQGQKADLNFICTHNSRRSQFSQIWAKTAADYFGVSVNCFSGGVEVTAFNERAVSSLKQSGFKISSKGEENPVYLVSNSEEGDALNMFSKIFDDDANASSNFAAVMTCSHADENCPFIPGAEQRISVRYEDPKAFDDTPQETEKYRERSLQIASEMLYIFSKISL